MKDKQEIRILVVEDDPDWLYPLCEMYKDILKLSSFNPKVSSEMSGMSAINRIRNGEKFNLLSCDINLGLTHKQASDGGPDKKVPGADGRAVLEEAKKWQACNGVVVVSGLDHDKSIRIVIPDEDDLEPFRMSPTEYLQKIFPNKNSYLKKSEKYNISKNIQIFKDKLLTDKRLIKLCEALPHVVPPYTIDLSGKSRNEFDPILAIKSRKVRGVSVPITHKKDALFLYSLGKIKDTDPYFVTKEFVCGIYEVNNADALKEPKLSKVANTCIDSAKRRIRKLGLEPKELFVSIRESGWKLQPSITLRGFASVDVRSSGSGGKNQERDWMSDVEDHNAIDPNDERYLCDE